MIRVSRLQTNFAMIVATFSRTPRIPGLSDRLVMTDAGLYAVVDNNRAPRPRPEVYSYVLDRWLPSTTYQYSDLSALEFFTSCPVEANKTWAPVCTMLVPLE